MHGALFTGIRVSNLGVWLRHDSTVHCQGRVKYCIV